MVVTCVAFTRSLPASSALRELPIEAAATGHLDRRYLAGSRIRTGRLPDVVLDFRGRPITLVARALHHRRVELVDLVLEVADPEAAAYLAAFDRTAAAVAAELFRRGDDRHSVASLHEELATDLLEGRPDASRPGAFRRVVFSRGGEAPAGAAPGFVAGHHVTVTRERMDVQAETTVLPDDRLGYEMVVGLAARSVVLADRLVDTVDGLAIVAGDRRADLGAVLDEGAEAQRRAVVVQREVTAHRLLAAGLCPVAERVDEVMGLGPAGREELERSVASLGQLTAALSARSVEQRLATWDRYLVAGLVLLAVIAGTLLVQVLA